MVVSMINRLRDAASIFYDNTTTAFTGTVEDIQAAIEAIKVELDATGSLSSNFEFRNSVLDYVVDNTLAPVVEITGARYILSHDGGVPHVDYDGAVAGDEVEFDGSVWVARTPTIGTFISADDEPDSLYYWGGSSWNNKAFENTTASTGLVKVGADVQMADQAQNGASVVSGVISVVPDDVTTEISANQVIVKDGGISIAKLGTDVNGTGGAAAIGADATGHTVLTGTTTQAQLDQADTAIAANAAAAAAEWVVITANTVLLPNTKYLVDSTAGPLTLTLPASPTAGQWVKVRDASRNAKTNTLTILRNGNNIDSVADDVEYRKINGIEVEFAYTDATIGYSTSAI